LAISVSFIPKSQKLRRINHVKKASNPGVDVPDEIFLIGEDIMNEHPFRN